jgi:predicted  nucleic acid-binding Zn-ribbon protein
VIEQLRAELAKATQAASTTVSRYDLDNMRDERNQAHAAYSRALGELDELRNAVETANARADRQAARAERAEAETRRAKATTAVLARALRDESKALVLLTKKGEV